MDLYTWKDLKARLSPEAAKRIGRIKDLHARKKAARAWIHADIRRGHKDKASGQRRLF